MVFWGGGAPRRAQTCRDRAVRPAGPQLMCLHLVPAVSFVVLLGDFGLFRVTFWPLEVRNRQTGRDSQAWRSWRCHGSWPPRSSWHRDAH